MLLIVEKGIRGGRYHEIHWYTKSNDKCMKNYDKNKESSYLTYWDVNNSYGWTMSQKLPVYNFSFIKIYNEESNEGCFLEVDVQYPKKLHKLHNDLTFCLRGWRLKK